MRVSESFVAISFIECMSPGSDGGGRALGIRNGRGYVQLDRGPDAAAARKGERRFDLLRAFAHAGETEVALTAVLEHRRVDADAVIADPQVEAAAAIHHVDVDVLRV